MGGREEYYLFVLEKGGGGGGRGGGGVDVVKMVKSFLLCIMYGISCKCE